MEVISIAILKQLTASCTECGTTSDIIDQEQSSFSCSSESPTSVTYSARLEGTSQTDSGSLVSLIEEWVSGGASIIVNGVLIRVDSECPVAISFLGEGECSPTQSPTTEHTITPTTDPTTDPTTNPPPHPTTEPTLSATDLSSNSVTTTDPTTASTMTTTASTTAAAASDSTSTTAIIVGGVLAAILIISVTVTVIILKNRCGNVPLNKIEG